MLRQLTLSLLAAVALAEATGAQAYCALRDPSGSLFELFPEATEFRSHVGTVTKESRAAVSEVLPFTLHFNELGRHTLYVPTKDGEPLGFVHARSAKGRWGLVEIVWAFDLDLRVRDYRFQRCRSGARAVVESDAYRERLRGRGLEQLSTWTEGRSPLPVPPDDPDLPDTLLRCALKTIVVTEQVWPEEVLLARAHGRASRLVGTGDRVIPVPRDELARSYGGESDWGIDRGRTRAFQVLDGDDRRRGLLVVTPWSLGDERATLWWGIRGGALRGVDAQGGWSREELRASFEACIEHGDDSSCGTAICLAWQEVLALSHRLTPGG